VSVSLTVTVGETDTLLIKGFRDGKSAAYFGSNTQTVLASWAPVFHFTAPAESLYRYARPVWSFFTRSPPAATPSRVHSEPAAMVPEFQMTSLSVAWVSR
jgi:hypothetical protein